MTRYLRSPIALWTKLRWKQHYWAELDCNLHVSIKAAGVRWLGVRLGGGRKKIKKKYSRKRDLTERQGSSQLTNDAKVDPYECNYHRRLALILIKGAENLSLGAFFSPSLPLMSFPAPVGTASVRVHCARNDRYKQKQSLSATACCCCCCCCYKNTIVVTDWTVSSSLDKDWKVQRSKQLQLLKLSKENKKNVFTLAL